jgi:3-deoxy-7-phosphoheptulonate synthase
MLDHQTLLSPQALQQNLPLDDSSAQFISESREKLISILNGQKQRFIVIVGPCSIHDTASTLEYAQKLHDLALRTPHLYLVMRTYFEKSRSAGGWKGFLYDPYLKGSDNIPEGLMQTRQLLLKIAAMQVPTAAELIEPCATSYLIDLLSWSCIGARTTTSQIHRQMTSGLPMPVGFKNSLDGNIEYAIQSAAVAAQSHQHLGINTQGQISTITTEGNPNAHIVLRGSHAGGNYDAGSIRMALASLHERALTPGLLVDCSHGNSQRQPERQGAILNALIDLVEQKVTGIRGALLESHLYSGSQSLHPHHQLKYGISITDPCMCWDETEELLLSIDQRLSKQSQSVTPSLTHCLN